MSKLGAITFRGDRLKQVRESRGFTQNKLAELAGTDNVQLSRYENGKVEPSLKMLALLAENLDVSTDYLLGLSDDPRKRYGDSELKPDELTMVETLRRDGWVGVLQLVAERIRK